MKLNNIASWFNLDKIFVFDDSWMGNSWNIIINILMTKVPLINPVIEPKNLFIFFWILILSKLYIMVLIINPKINIVVIRIIMKLDKYKNWLFWYPKGR